MWTGLAHDEIHWQVLVNTVMNLWTVSLSMDGLSFSQEDWSKNITMNCEHYPWSCLLFKARHFGDWSVSPSSGGTYSGGPNR
jgi:hypothetical protein